MLFELTDTPITPHTLESLHTHTGAVVTFEGRVRALNEGRTVTALDYEAYPALAISEGSAIVAESLTRFGLLFAHGVHRTGHLKIGEIAVRVVACSMHRKEAFQATEHIIHEIKRRLPIWKKEWYADGGREWVRCNHHEHAGA